MIQRTSLVFCLLGAVAVAACGGSTSPETDDPAASSSDIKGGPTKPAPKCCDPAAEPPPGIEGVWCCGDGSWQYDIGVGNAKATCKSFGGVGQICKPPPKPKPTCCDPATKPPPGIEGVWCCGDGTWQYDIGSGNQNASCGARGGAGTVCGGEGEACGGPPPVALCAPCPGITDLNKMYKIVNGKPTCECCTPTK